MGDIRAAVDEVDPAQAYALLSEEPGAVLVDVRTRAEWTFVGVPDLSGTGCPLWLIEWVQYPSMTPNPDFVAELEAHAREHAPTRLLFICRSGQRSMAAARLASDVLSEAGHEVACSNVAEGFEGDRDDRGRRGSMGGWRAKGLPWVQG